MRNFNHWLAQKITSLVSTMTCAYLFAALALVSLPDAIHGGRATLVAWVAQTFLQLVLLSIIMVGQTVQSDRAEAVIRETHDAVLEELALLHTKVDKSVGSS